jgi:hypothetical protein
VWIKSFTLSNFKSFDVMPTIELDRHINVLVGQNHSGKTTLLNALALRLTRNPHNSSKYRVGQPRAPASFIDLTFVMSGLEFRDYVSGFSSNISFPVPEGWAREAAGDPKKVLDRIFDLKEIEFKIRRNAAPNGINWQMLPSYPSNNLEVVPPHFINFARIENGVDFHIPQMNVGQNDNAAIIAAERLPPSIYYFNAQRTPSEPKTRQHQSERAGLAAVPRKQGDKVRPPNAMCGPKSWLRNNLERAPTSKMTSVARTRDERRAVDISVDCNICPFLLAERSQFHASRSGPADD